MLQLISKNWWMLVLRGTCAILFGILALARPGVTLGALVLLWGAYAFTDGILAFAAAISGAGSTRWWVLVLEGLVGVAAAVATFIIPGMTVIVLLYMIAAWALVTGVMKIVAAIQLRQEIEGEIWLALAGIASLLFGLGLFARPGAGALAVIWLIGSFAIVFGVLLVALGFRLKAARAQYATSGS
jgi:uncharacterized membrane protein HdeD (DUF308 family)